jgi:hypothetical protein
MVNKGKTHHSVVYTLYTVTWNIVYKWVYTTNRMLHLWNTEIISRLIRVSDYVMLCDVCDAE